MNNIFRFTKLSFAILASLLVLVSCNDFLDPDQELNIKESKLFDDWYEYRSVEMGMYALMQDLVEQLLILGELRGDLLTTTENADADMVEVENFTISKNNRFADPTNFFKLISATNNFIRILERKHPEVAIMDSAATNFDRLYGEALCMRAWAYFNAVRIYGKVPYIHESLVTMDEITAFIESPGTYTDSIYIEYSIDGYYNDTTYNKVIELEKNYFDLEMVINHFTYELETKIKEVGVDHAIINNDDSWEVSIWNTYAYHTLLGHMYLTAGDYVKAVEHFSIVVDKTDIFSETSPNNPRYQLHDNFAEGNWRNIFTGIDNTEHILTLWFNKSNFQQNEFQNWFEAWGPHSYMLKPSGPAIFKWETVWSNQSVAENTAKPEQSVMGNIGEPGDFARGYGSSFIYLKNNDAISFGQWMYMLQLKAREDFRSAEAITEDADTIVYKYSINKDVFDQDANYIVYRAGGVHLWLAEAFVRWVHWDVDGDLLFASTAPSKGIVNGGSYFNTGSARPQRGVRGRAGLFLNRDWDGVLIRNDHYIHDPYTNEIIGYRNLFNNQPAKQLIMEDGIMDERARELAFEGERFYDLMRMAKRRNDPSYLANAVASKFHGAQRDAIYNYLLDENHWYIDYFE